MALAIGDTTRRSGLASVPRNGTRRHRLLLEQLEGRLPLGETALGVLAAASLLHVGVAVAWPESSSIVSEPAAFAKDTAAFAYASGSDQDGLSATGDPFAWPDRWAIRPAQEAAPDCKAAIEPFATGARRTLDPHPVSPQREQGPDTIPSLALRANESGPAPTFVAPHTNADLLATLAALYQPPAPAPAAASPDQETQVQENFGKLPLYFEQNVGQTDAAVHFFTRGPGYGLYLTSTEAVMVLHQPTPPQPGDMASDRLDAGRAGPHTTGINPVARQVEELPAVVRLQFTGANPAPTVTGRDEQPGKVNYFLGNDPAKWHTNIATFGRVEYDNVYPGIDLVYYGTNRQLEYDFIVAPGADPGVIRLNVSGAERLELDAAGDLLIHAGEPGGAGEPRGVSPGSTLRQHAPVVYQEIGGQRQEVASRFMLEGQQVRFALGAYDAGRPLVIDPVLSYSTYLGGSNYDGGEDLAVDPATGDALVTGRTNSTNFPTANPLQPVYGGGSYDVFVTRLNASGSALVYSTYLGGSGSNGDVGTGIAVDPATGDALVTGSTTSTNFPTANPLQASLRGSADAFVTRLNAAGSALVFSTYLGGNNADIGTGIAVVPVSGDALVTGYTFSTTFPTANPLQASNGGASDVFVSRLNAAGSALVFSTYLGGSNADEGSGLAVDPATGDALVTGRTNSTNFPTANPLQATYAGGYMDAFVTRLHASGSALVYSTYLGGSGDENPNATGAIAVDPATGDALVTGETRSTNFPTANPLQPALAGCGPISCDAFVTRLNAAGSALVFSTYLGGSGDDSGLDLAVDPASRDALVTGSTRSTNFPTANPLQATLRGTNDVFVTRLNAAGSALVYSTYLGGSGSNGDVGTGIAVDPATGDALVTGSTTSTNFPTANPLQATLRGTNDVFVTRLNAAGSALVFSTYLGGSSNEGGSDIAVDPASGDALVTGQTGSTDFPTRNPFQPSLGGLSDAFVTKILDRPCTSLLQCLGSKGA